jgi:hypothetical protein
MKNLILLVLSVFALTACGKSNTSSNSNTSCTYQSNGTYLYNGGTYSYCPASTSSLTSAGYTLVGSSCYYNGTVISTNGTCPTTGVGGITGVVGGTHNCANLTMTDVYGNVGVCSIQVNYCSGYTMYYGGQAVRCY